MMATPHATLAGRVESVEEAYEFMLAFAARGTGDEDADGEHGIRFFLGRLAEALDGLAAAAAEAVPPGGIEAAATAFVAVLEEDAARALAAVRLVLACPRIGPQTVDNLNASLHLRATLTDLFLLDEIIDDKGGNHVDQA